MSAEMNMRLRQMHAAMGEVAVSDLSRLGFRKRKKGETAVFDVFDIDFSLGADDAQLNNIVESLLHNLGSLRDHLQAYCDASGRKFEGDDLINSNLDVGVVHDLWNRSKHPNPNRSRSKLFPRLKNIRRTMRVMPTSDDATIEFVIDPRTGQPTVRTGDANATVEVFAEVFDNRGQKIGLLMDIAQRAISAWEAEMTKVGLPLPAKP